MDHLWARFQTMMRDKGLSSLVSRQLSLSHCQKIKGAGQGLQEAGAVHSPVCTNGMEMEMVKNFMFLGVNNVFLYTKRWRYTYCYLVNMVDFTL